jgi:hypothetical protein
VVRVWVLVVLAVPVLASQPTSLTVLDDPVLRASHDVT